MRYHLPLVTGLREPPGHRFGALAILLWTDSNAMKLAGSGGQLAEEGGKALFPEVRRKPLGIFLVAETASCTAHMPVGDSAAGVSSRVAGSVGAGSGSISRSVSGSGLESG
jgi:hypothetical protein